MKANFSAPEETGNFKVKFDIINGDGQIIAPEGGRMYVEFTVDPCASIAAPALQSMDVWQSGQGYSIPTAGASDDTGEMSVNLDFNGENEAMNLMDDGSYGSQKNVGRNGSNSYQIAAENM